MLSMETLIMKATVCCRRGAGGGGGAHLLRSSTSRPRNVASCEQLNVQGSHALNCSSSQPFLCSVPPHIRSTRSRALSSERGSQHSPGPIRAVPVQVAHELLNAGHRYLDVRTAEEFASGHIEGAVNIPYMYKAGPGLTKNVKFLDDVGGKFGKDDEIVVGCQMGKRSQMAAEELVAAGFTGITDMAGGYMAWRQSGMPTKTSV